jgi:hypothetical protein
MYKHIVLRSPTVFPFLLALPTSLLIVLPVLYFGNKNQGWFMTQNEKLWVQIIIEALSFIGLCILGINKDNEYIILLLGQFLYPIVTLLKMYPSRELLENNFYVVYLLNLYFSDLIPSMLYVLSALVVTA